MCVFDHSLSKCKISVDHRCFEYSNNSNIQIKVSESLDSDSDSVQLQMSNKIRIRIRKKFFDEYYSDSDSPEKKDSFQHWSGLMRELHSVDKQQQITNHVQHLFFWSKSDSGVAPDISNIEYRRILITSFCLPLTFTFYLAEYCMNSDEISLF